jgi:hypothetical protein
MKMFIKPLTSRTVLNQLRREGATLVEATFRCFYVLSNGAADLPALMREWFVEWNGKSHAYRDNSHVGGADKVVGIRDLTAGKRISLCIKKPAKPARQRADALEFMTDFNKAL